MQAIASIDTVDVQAGIKLLTYINLKTIMSVAEQYFTGDAEFDSEIIQEGITAVFKKVKEFDETYSSAIPQQIHRTAKVGIEAYLENSHVVSELASLPTSSEKLSEEDFAERISKISQKTGIQTREVLQFVKILQGMSEEPYTDESVSAELFNEEQKKMLYEVLDTLTPRERFVIRSRFGLTDGIPVTLEQLGRELGGISKDRVRQIEGDAFRKLRHPSRSRTLRGSLNDSVSGYINGFDTPRIPIPIMKHPIAILNLPRYVHDVLRVAEVDTVQKLTEMPYGKLVEMFGFDRSTLKIILDHVDNYFTHEDVAMRGESLPVLTEN